MNWILLFLFSLPLSSYAQEALPHLVRTWDQLHSEITSNSLKKNVTCSKGSKDQFGFIPSSSGHHIEVSVISYKEGLKIFKEILDDESFPFKYPEDGCYARAHKMSWIFDDKKLSSVKVFIEGNLKVETSHSPNGYVTWWYHVAPVLLLKKDDKIEPYVFDPSLFDKPVRVEEWKNIQTKHKEGKTDQIYFTERFNYYPMSKDNMECQYQDWHCTNTEKTLNNYLEIQKQRTSEVCTPKKLNPKK